MKIKFVSILSSWTEIPGILLKPVARLRALEWSCDKRSTIFSIATIPAAAIIPACRIADPNHFLHLRASFIVLWLPQINEPTGHPRPLERQNVTVSTSFTSADTGISKATAALNNLAPSICTGIFRSLATLIIGFISSGAIAIPPMELCVFSSAIRVVFGYLVESS